MSESLNNRIDAAANALLNRLTEQQKKSGIEHFAIIGSIALGWAVFESRLDRAILELARIPENFGLCLTAQVIGPARKLDAYMAIARLRGGEAFAGEFEKFAKATVQLGERRNRVLHDPWVVHSLGGIPHRIETTAKRKLKNEPIPMGRNDLLALCSEIDSHIIRLNDLHERIRAAVDTLPDKPQPESP